MDDLYFSLHVLERKWLLILFRSNVYSVALPTNLDKSFESKSIKTNLTQDVQLHIDGIRSGAPWGVPLC